ncbi:MAG: hypothetical protein HGA75_08390 [Thiobacillus sp.]|nr:hypothetical protein [Thiobacillus sp.]
MAKLIGLKLFDIGFVETSQSDSPEYIQWRRYSGDNLSHQIMLRAFEYGSDLYFRTEISIHSLQVRAVLNDVKAWQCFQTPAQLVPDPGDPVCVLHLGAVEWWEAYHRGKEMHADSSYRAWRVPSSPEENPVDEWLNCFIEHGRWFIDDLSTMQDVVNFLEMLDILFNKKSHGMDAPGSADPVVYSAILRYLIGDYYEAKYALIGKKTDLARGYRESEFSRNVYESNLCELDRLLDYFSVREHQTKEPLIYSLPSFPRRREPS